MSRNRRAALALPLLAATCYLAALGVRPLTAPDETRYAEIPREMLADGDWVVPRLNGIVYFEKPPLGYWAAALSEGAFGHNAFAARLPYALATLLSALVIAGLVRRCGSGPREGALAATVFLSSAFVAGTGTYAVLDPLLSFWITAALAAFFVATEHPPGRARLGWLALCGAASGAAFLTKGFVALAVLALPAAVYLAWMRRFRDLLAMPWTPIAAAALVAAPWSLAVARADPGFWPYFFWVEHVQRFAGGADAQHPQPFWLYVPVLLGGMLPWTLVIGPATRGCIASRRDRLVRFAVAWALLPLLLFSAADGKLPTYVLPCFAPLAILFARGLTAIGAATARAWLGRAAIAFGVVLALAGVAVLVQSTTGFIDLDDVYVDAESWKAYAGAGALLAAAAAALLGARSRSAAGRTAGIAGAVGALLLAGPFALPAWNGYKTPTAWLEVHRGEVPDDAIVVTDTSMVHGACWVLRRSDLLLLGVGELEYGLARPEHASRAIDGAALASMADAPDRTRPIIVLCRRRVLERLPSDLTRSAEIRRDMAFLRLDAPAAAPAP